MWSKVQSSGMQGLGFQKFWVQGHLAGCLGYGSLGCRASDSGAQEIGAVYPIREPRANIPRNPELLGHVRQSNTCTYNHSAQSPTSTESQDPRPRPRKPMPCAQTQKPKGEEPESTALPLNPKTCPSWHLSVPRFDTLNLLAWGSGRRVRESRITHD